MRKLVFVFGFMVLAAAAARAEECDNGPLEWINCASMSTAFATLSSFGAFQDPKAAYLAQLKDDAANYVASGEGQLETALLKEAVEGIRAHVTTARDLTDREIAILLLQAGN